MVNNSRKDESDSNSRANDTKTTANGPGQGQKPSFLKRTWDKTGLDTFTLLLMFKGSLPPTIALAAYQSRAWSQQYGSLGYLVAITSILGFCIMPRGKFVQTMALNVIAVGVAAAVNLLALYCVTQARAHTTPAGSTATYNSSASAICAIWLMVQVYFVNALRAARPQFQFPAIIYSIFVSVSMSYGTVFPTMASAISFMEELLESFLTGFALATGVSLFIIPVSSRQVVFKEITGYLTSLNGLVKAQTALMQELENFQPEAVGENGKIYPTDTKAMKSKQQPPQPVTSVSKLPQVAKLRELMAATYDLHAKLQGDLIFAKREVGYGKLDAKDLTHIFKLLRRILIPVSGLCSTVDIFRQYDGEHNQTEQLESKSEQMGRERKLEDLHHLMHSLHKPFATMSSAIDQAVQHILITLELIKPAKPAADEESGDMLSAPGTSGFAERFKSELDTFYESKKHTLREWTSAHGFELPEDLFEPTYQKPGSISVEIERAREKYQSQLFFTLYLEHLLWRAGQAVLELVLYADTRKQEGVLGRSRLILPGAKTIRKWIGGILGREDTSNDSYDIAELDAGGHEKLDLGESYGKNRNPEHLPPQTNMEKIGELVRTIPKFLRSDSSAFGFRVVCATMTVAIIAFLEASQGWFLENRLLWAMIMIAISMTRTAGQSVMNFLLRIGGTAIAMVGAYIVWYIVVGHTAGVLVFTWLWMFAAFYVVLKLPKFTIVGILSLVTVVLIIGYELQVKVNGVQATESSGQPAYPTYILAPYRLATVAGGIFVAFIWTIFPYPISESSELRRDIGAALFLLANFYSVAHETVKSRIQKIDGDERVKGTRGYHLEKARSTLLNKQIQLLSALRMTSAFSRFQIHVGGKFPREEYEGLIYSIECMVRFIMLISYASSAYSSTAGDSAWSSDFRKLMETTTTTSHQLTSTLALLSSSVSHGRPLPPYLEAPKFSHYVRKMNSIDHDILNMRHIVEPEYSAFAVMQICAQGMEAELRIIQRHVKTLVGEIDFSFHVVSTSQDTSEESSAVGGEKD